MPTILQITIDGNIGSTGRIAESIGNLAIARGWKSYIAHGRFSRKSESEIIKIGSVFEVWTHGIQTRLFDRHGLGSKSATINLVKKIKEINPDVIHIHSIHGYYINIEVLFRFLSKASIPVIWTFHDCWSITGHCTHFDYVKCEKWKTECHHCPQKREYPASYFLDRSRENYKLKKELFASVPKITIVSVSKWLDSVVQNSFLGHLAREVIYNGIDTDIFTPLTDKKKVKEKLNIVNGFIILGVAGVWPKQKGLADFIKLSKIIGNGDSIVLVGLSKSQISGLPYNIIGIERTENQEELKDLYATADVFLNLSVEETFGLTTAEALSCGTPAIVYNSTACPELVDSRTGIVVKRNDIDELLAAIGTVKQNGRAFYSAACRDRAIQMFNKNKRFNEYINLYERESSLDRKITKTTFDMNSHDINILKEKNIQDNYQICSNCVMDTSDSIIEFDKNGVCDHCHDFETSVKPNLYHDESGMQNIIKMINKVKAAGKGKDFDCLLGLSGGIDSSYMLHFAVKELGLRPLVFHVDGGWNSELAVHNINVMIDKLGLDLYTEVINWEEMKDFQLAFFKSGLPHIDIPQDHAFIATMYHFANKYNVKYILNGGNYSTECVQYPLQWLYYGTDMVHIKDIRDQFGTNKMGTYPFSSVFYHKIYLKYIKGITVVKPLNFMPYIKSDAMELLEKEYGWKPYPQKHFESRFTKFYEGYWLPERFGFDTRKVQFSSLILTGQMTRNQALEILKKPAYDPATINDEFNYIATKLGITSDELKGYFNLPKKFYWDYKNQQSIFKLGARILNILGVEKVKKRKK